MHLLTSERVEILQKFLTRITSIITFNSHHPSTMKLHLHFQRFLAVTTTSSSSTANNNNNNNNMTNLEKIILRESDPANFPIRRLLEVFIHNLLHMSIIHHRIIQLFIDKFNSQGMDEVGTSSSNSNGNSYYERQCAAIVGGEFKVYMDSLQNFFDDCFHDDCVEIIDGIVKIGELLLPSSHGLQLLRRLSSTSQQHSSHQIETTAKQQQAVVDGQPGGQSREEKRESSTNDLLIQLTADEIRLLIRSAIRRQLEALLYLGVVGRISYLIQQAYSRQQQQFTNRCAFLRGQPQSYYDIQVEHLSPSSWNKVVRTFQQKVGQAILPCDKLEGLLDVSKMIFTVYDEEHPIEAKKGHPMGADDVLPIFIYVIVQAQVPNLIFINHELQYLCDEDKRFSEVGYYLATLQASITHILEADLQKERPFFSLLEVIESREGDEDDEDEKN